MLNMHFELSQGACFMLKLREQIKDLIKDKLQTQVTDNSRIFFPMIM